MQKQENDYLDEFLNLQHYSEIELTKKRNMDDDTVGTQTAVYGLTNVSPQSRASMGTAWTKWRYAQKSPKPGEQDHVPMAFETAKTERMDDLMKESQENKKEMERLGNELRKLKDDMAAMTVSQEAQKETNRKQESWQQQMDQQITGIWEDMKEMRGFMQQILQMMNSQIGQLLTPPVNLGFISNSAVLVAGSIMWLFQLLSKAYTQTHLRMGLGIFDFGPKESVRAQSIPAVSKEG